MTNHHVIEGANKLDVTMSNDDITEAEILGSDEYLDLAVIRIAKKYVKQVATLGDSTNSNVGGTAWTSVTSSESLNVGTYYMYATVAETTNYASKTTAATAKSRQSAESKAESAESAAQDGQAECRADFASCPNEGAPGKGQGQQQAGPPLKQGQKLVAPSCIVSTITSPQSYETYIIYYIANSRHVGSKCRNQVHGQGSRVGAGGRAVSCAVSD